MTTNEQWGVWFITYATYAEMDRDGDIPPRLVCGPLSLSEAQGRTAELGVGYCVKPWGAR